MRLIYVYTFILLIVSCIPMDMSYPIYLTNNSSKELYYHINYSYPDTILPETRKYVYLIKAGEKQLITASTHEWSVKEFGEYFPSDTLSIFFISSNTNNAYEWAEIRSQYKILERCEYNYQDLENMNWEITYP